MSKARKSLIAKLYTKEHEYIRVDGDTGVCGISNFAQSELGEIIKVILPENGKTIKKGDEICYVESPKESSKVYAPVSGKIVEINSSLEDSPELINEDPYGKGWIYKVKLSDATELKALMVEADYEKYIQG